MPEITTELYRRIAMLERQVSTLNRRGKASGWQLNSMFDMHRYGGGKLVWAFDGQSRNQYGEVGIWNARGGLTMNNYRTATYGGPNVTFDGVGEYLANADSPWNETDTEELLVWGWCYATSLAASAVVAAKWDGTGGNWRCWRLFYNLGAVEFVFAVNLTGLVGATISATSTYGGPVVDTWYFVAGYFEASTTLNIYVGASTDAALVADKVVVAVPVRIFNGGAAELTIGAQGDPATYWPGNIGKVLGRANVPSAVIDDHVNMLFVSSREFYAE